MINDRDINEIIVSSKFPFGKQDFKYFIGYKDTKERKRAWCIFFPEMSMYKRYSDKTNSMYLMIKVESFFDKYMIIWGKFSNKIKKKFNSELIYNKKYLKTEKGLNTKESFQCFYIPVMLIHSVYRKKMETIILKCF